MHVIVPQNAVSHGCARLVLASVSTSPTCEKSLLCTANTGAHTKPFFWPAFLQRKRAEDAADATSTATRATRSSARLGKKGASDAVESTSATTASHADDSIDATEAPPPKKSKAAPKKAPAKPKATKASKSRFHNASRAKNAAPAVPQAGPTTDNANDEPAKADGPKGPARAHLSSSFERGLCAHQGAFERGRTRAAASWRFYSLHLGSRVSLRMHFRLFMCCSRPNDDENRTSKAAKFDPSKPEPYSHASAAALFGTYADPDDPSVIGPEGFEKLLGDAEIPMEGAMPLLLAWQLEAKEMAKFTKDEWMKGMDNLQISSFGPLSLCLHELHDLLVLDKPPLARPSSIAASASKKKKVADIPQEPYNRARYRKYASDSRKAFSSMYAFCFQLTKPEYVHPSPAAHEHANCFAFRVSYRGSRNIDMETASALWSVLLVPRYPLMTELMQFVNESGSYKGVNKDLWAMTLEFCQTVDPDLGNYEADGAWPSMLDEFARWKKEKNGSQPSAAEDAVNVEA
ncbi:hypothetical protein EVG20_g675 [Dentipellis fragilis]|uniref:Defective in cullin neddylation protein n=1 Tax=Dentipellis fragilis TaxID=205917 RepID=A0A4Y9ZBZ8_9AGAM|nr:hypothetical protein EVG20_g675 [Dentipellis fragilis]